MNWAQLKCLVAALAIAFVVVSFVGGSRMARQAVKVRIATIGHDLIENTNSPSLVRVGPDLQQTLSNLLSSTTRVARVSLGDVPMGDGTATGHLILSNALGQSVGIRLRRNSSTGEQFGILEFWTTFEESGTNSLLRSAQ